LKRAIIAGYLAGAIFVSSAAVASAQGLPWILPNFSDRLELQVSNPTDSEINALAIVPVAKAGQIALRFPGTLAIAIIPGSRIRVLPSQADDLDGDGQPDEFVFPITMKANERITVHVYYSTTLHDVFPWPSRVYASHSFGYNRSTVSLESEAIGYRTYGGFFLDVQARAKGQQGLNNNLVGYLSAGASSPSPAGRDILHIGDTLGLGGLFLRSGEDVFRPPLNVPDYTHRPSLSEAPSYRVLTVGPVRAVVEARLDHWTIGKDAVSIRALYSIAMGSEDVECNFTILPLSLSRTYEVGAGIRHLPKMHTDIGQGRLAIEGEQESSVGPLGLALYFDPALVSRTGILKTKDDDNTVAVFGEHLTPGHAVSGRYWVAADWSGSGIANLLGHLAELQQQARATVIVDSFMHQKTPAPGRLEGEAY
jgi:Domain of unknown function (DUF4861)